jgi:RNA polymerase sigma factor (sigma-70 family)
MSVGLILTAFALVIAVLFGVDQYRRGRETTRLLNGVLELLKSQSPPRVEVVAQDFGEGAEAATVTRRRFSDAIRKLPEREKLALTLRYYEDFTFEQIAEALGVTPATVESLLARAVKRLREMLYRA